MRHSPRFCSRRSRRWSRTVSRDRSTTSAWTGATCPRSSRRARPSSRNSRTSSSGSRNNGGMGTFYRSRHELIFVFKHGTTPHCNTFELGQHGRYRTNVWQYRGVNSRGADRMAGPRPAPHGQAGAPDRGRHPRRLGPGRDRARWVRRVRLDPDRRGKDRPAGAPLRDRPRLLRPHPRPLGDLCHGRRHAAAGRDRWANEVNRTRSTSVRIRATFGRPSRMLTSL